MVFDIPALVAHISSVMTLLPGDLILTGTPAGVGPMQVDDEVEVSIAGLGTLTNNHYSAVTLAPDGSAYVATLAGMVRVRDSDPG